MIRRSTSRIAAVAAFCLALGSCTGVDSAGSAASLFNQLGGMETVTKLGSDLLASAMKDPRLTSLLGKVNPSLASPKVANQLCAALGGGCDAPFTDDQIANAANKLSPEQKEAVSDSFASTLNAITSNPALREAVTKSLGPKMGGIVGALL
jgi:hypothetical protein